MSETPVTSPGAAEAAPSPDPTGAYAIIEASGQQFWLQSERYIDLDRIAAEEGFEARLAGDMPHRGGVGLVYQHSHFAPLRGLRLLLVSLLRLDLLLALLVRTEVLETLSNPSSLP